MILLRHRLLTAVAAASAVSAVGVQGCGGSTAPVAGGADAAATSDGSTPASDAPTSTTADAHLPVDAAGFVCEVGTKSTECFTHDELAFMIANPPRGGDLLPDGGGDYDPDGCLPAGDVKNGCCSPAALGPSFEGGKCCYVFCTTGCCGRPFILDGTARVAEVIARSGWSTRDRPDTALLDEPARRILGDAWARDAATEHASIAAFARFSLDLLAFGAPSDLVRGAHAAASDEIVHAEAAFHMASRFRGEDVGPGPLPAHGASVSPSLARAVAVTIHEGCVGEVIAALVAQRGLERTEDDEARRALERVCEDEARHAELAFRFVVWAIEAGGPEVRDEARRAFLSALEVPIPELREREDEILLGRFGQISLGERDAITREARSKVLRPLYDAVFSTARCGAGASRDLAT